MGPASGETSVQLVQLGMAEQRRIGEVGGTSSGETQPWGRSLHLAYTYLPPQLGGGKLFILTYTYTILAHTILLTYSILTYTYTYTYTILYLSPTTAAGWEIVCCCKRRSMDFKAAS